MLLWLVGEFLFPHTMIQQCYTLKAGKIGKLTLDRNHKARQMEELNCWELYIDRLAPNLNQ